MAKRKSKTTEETICRKRLDALDQQELPRSDRFSLDEKKQLLHAYNERGFTVFQDIKLLKQYFPSRHEADLRGLIDRYNLNVPPKNENPLLEWQNICNKLLGTYAKDKKVNLDNALSVAFLVHADELKTTQENASLQGQNEPDYCELLTSFSHLLAGKFPDQIKPATALLSMKLYEDLMEIVDNIDLKQMMPLEDGSWLKGMPDRRKQLQALAHDGLKELDSQLKKCPTMADIEKSPAIEALCLELPKIKRIEVVLNPLQLEENLMRGVERQWMDLEAD